MKNQESKIAFTNDIIREVAKELGISESKVKSVYRIQIMYLRYIVNETKAVAIFIPFIGTLYVRASHLFRKIRSLTNNIKKLNLYKEKKELVDLHIQTTIQEKTGKSRHLEKASINRKRYNAGKDMKEIENIQNNR